MNYQHAYHAGSMHDVFKHVILVQLLKFLDKKPSAFCYMDTHSGKALYNLTDEQSQKTNEYKEGIYRLWHAKDISHPAIIDYLDIVKKYNPQNELNYYPGSGLFASSCLREQDEAILCELQPRVYEDLHNYFPRNKQVHVHHREGYQALQALLPPKIKRGMVLIDPPYEAKDEYQQLLEAITKAQIRWPNGIYAIWFPIKQYDVIARFYRNIKNSGFTNILATECWATTEDFKDNRLRGSGLVILNPPWQFDLLLDGLLPALNTALNINNSGKIFFTWLKNHSN